MAETSTKKDWDDFAEALKSAAHPERLAILHLICNSGRDRMMVKNIYETLHFDQPITSRHLGIMRKSGLLKREKSQGKTLYRFNKDSPIARRIRRLLTE